MLPSDRDQRGHLVGVLDGGSLHSTSLQINLSATVREAVTLPDSVTFSPGHYRLRVWLCEATDYNAETTFDVTNQ